MDFELRIWRQARPDSVGHLASHPVRGAKPGDTLLAVLDGLNDTLRSQNERPVAFAAQCRQGTCGLCAMVINGEPHGPGRRKATCEVTMSSFDAGSTITLEPWRARALPVLQDLTIDRGALDRILDAGGIAPTAASAKAGPKGVCIECGACVAACPNASASLFVGAKIAEHAALPSPRRRVLSMVQRMDEEGFGSCSSHRECAAACPKSIGVSVIAGLNRAFLSGVFRGPENGPRAEDTPSK